MQGVDLCTLCHLLQSGPVSFGILGFNTVVHLATTLTTACIVRLTGADLLMHPTKSFQTMYFFFQSKEASTFQEWEYKVKAIMDNKSIFCILIIDECATTATMGDFLI